MKTKVFFFTIVFIFPNFLFAADPIKEIAKNANSTDTLYVMGSRYILNTDGWYIHSPLELVFTGEDIISFNPTTRELVLTDPASKKFSPSNNEWIFYHWISLYLNDKLLFKDVRQVSPIDSYLINDLVFFLNPYYDYDTGGVKNQFYLNDGYPLPLFNFWPEEEEYLFQLMREANAEKRKSEWDIFIKYLSDRGKIITGKEEIKPAPPIQIYSSGKIFHINNQTGKNGIVTVYRIDGVKIAEQTMASQTTTVEIPVSGFYLVSVRTGNEKPVMEKVVVR